MTWIPAAIGFLRANRWSQIALAAGLAVLAFGFWLWRHDVAVREAERVKIEQQARAKAEKATEHADKRQTERQEVINETVDDLRNASGTDDWFERMRSRQEHSPAR